MKERERVDICFDLGKAVRIGEEEVITALRLVVYRVCLLPRIGNADGSEEQLSSQLISVSGVCVKDGKLCRRKVCPIPLPDGQPTIQVGTISLSIDHTRPGGGLTQEEATQVRLGIASLFKKYPTVLPDFRSEYIPTLKDRNDCMCSNMLDETASSLELQTASGILRARMLTRIKQAEIVCETMLPRESVEEQHTLWIDGKAPPWCIDDHYAFCVALATRAAKPSGYDKDIWWENTTHTASALQSLLGEVADILGGKPQPRSLCITWDHPKILLDALISLRIWELSPDIEQCSHDGERCVADVMSSMCEERRAADPVASPPQVVDVSHMLETFPVCFDPWMIASTCTMAEASGTIFYASTSCMSTRLALSAALFAEGTRRHGVYTEALRKFNPVENGGEQGFIPWAACWMRTGFSIKVYPLYL